MATKFGFLSKLDFLQNWASFFIAGINPAVIHNIEKYYIMKKVWYLSAIEAINGDYLEFGVFTGSSFCHSIRCCKKLSYLNINVNKTHFFGFDSFEGFGKLSETDKHPFYTDTNFTTNFNVVDRRVKKIAKKVNYKLVSGFFSDSLKFGHQHYGLKKARIIFIDSDTYSSANDALNFCLPIMQKGCYIILDDYFSYLGSEKQGVAHAFHNFIEKGKLKVRHVFNYGMGGVVYIISDIGE